MLSFLLSDLWTTDLCSLVSFERVIALAVRVRALARLSIEHCLKMFGTVHSGGLRIIHCYQ
jgi:hypothetical protein